MDFTVRGRSSSYPDEKVNPDAIPLSLLRYWKDTYMDEIEQGFQKLVDRIAEIEGKKEEKATLSEKVRKNDAALLGRMAKSAAPLIPGIGLNMVQRGKQDTKGELYDTSFTRKKMIVLGKTEPAEFRPDNPSKKVDDQFCVLSEDGKFYELMYSFDGFMVDSYLNPLTPREALDRYGLEVMRMLYHALHDYLKEEEELIKALRVTIDFVFPAKSPEKTPEQP